MNDDLCILMCEQFENVLAPRVILGGRIRSWDRDEEMIVMSELERSEEGIYLCLFRCGQVCVMGSDCIGENCL